MVITPVRLKEAPEPKSYTQVEPPKPRSRKIPTGDIKLADEVDDLNERDYRPGDPTFVFMKSRDPNAIFTCTHCGHNNNNTGRYPNKSKGAREHGQKDEDD